jgi:hypothetical protein
VTSHDVVGMLRKRFDERQVGHAGTLDPDATGVLVVAVGMATKLLRFVEKTRKRYVGEVVLGVETSTLDASGDITARHDMADVSLDDVRGPAAVPDRGRVLGWYLHPEPRRRSRRVARGRGPSGVAPANRGRIVRHRRRRAA